MAPAMAENGPDLIEEEGEEHEEGEISDEEPPPETSESEKQGVESSSHFVEADEAGDEPVAVPPQSSSEAQSLKEKDPPPMRKRVGLDELIELGSGTGELRPAYGHQSRKRDAYSGRIDVDVPNEDDGSNSRKRSDWGAYGANLYNFAWAQAVSGHPSSFASAGDSPSISPSSKVSTDGLLSSGLGGLGSWSSTESHKKLSREYSRDLDTYSRSLERSSEERDDMSPLRDNGSRILERIGSKRDATNRGRRIIGETSGSGRIERFVTVKSRIEKRERRGGSTEDDEYRRGQFDGGEESRWRKQRPESRSPNGRVDEREESRGGSTSEGTAQVEDNDENADREEGELEEGEIELASIPTQRDPDSPSSTREPPNFNRHNIKYGGLKLVDNWAKEKNYARSLSSKSQSRSQIDDYSSRNRHRQARPQESLREKSLSLAGELMKNVTVRDAQKSFVDVCGRLQKALKLLDGLHPQSASRQAGGLQDGRLESLPRDISVLARQAFAGIRAVYAVRNTASGREQERDKNAFPRLLELANGYCQKLFTPKQTRELEGMMQAIANAGRLVGDGTDKVQYPREHQFQPASNNKKSNDNDGKTGNNSLGDNNVGIVKTSAESTEITQSGSEISFAGRILGVVDAKQAEEAAALAAAALAYAQNSAAARVNSFGSIFDNRLNGTSVQGSGSWGFPSQVQQLNNPGGNPLQPNTSVYHNLPTGNKYQPQWNGTEQRPIKLGQDGYGGPFVAESKVHETAAPNPTLLQGVSKDSLIAPPGYNKPPATSTGMLEDEWEELSPPGAGLSSYGRLPGAPAVQPIGVKKDSAVVQGKVWPSTRPDIGTVLAYQKSRGNAPHYPPELLLNLNQQRSRANVNMYSTERLPSPTPDEDDDGSAAAALPPPPLGSFETKAGSLDAVGSKESNVIPQPQGVGSLSTSMLPGSIHNLIRTKSLDGSVPGIDPRIIQEGNSGDLSLPAATRVLDESDSVKNLHSVPLPGNFRSRDPRRRFHNNSVDLADMSGVDLTSQVIPGSNPSLGEATHPAGIDRNMKRQGPDVGDKQNLRMQKRAKNQSGNNFDMTGFAFDSLHAPAGTGGWLDDNVVPSFIPVEELPIAMEVDEDGPFTALEGRNGLGSDSKVVAESQLAVFPDFVNNNMAMNKKQRVDVGQQTGESGQRKMKPRDPRRVFLESHVEVGDSYMGDTVTADVTVSVSSDPRKAEVGSVLRATTEAPSWNDKEIIQASKHDANNIPPLTAGMAGISSVQVMKSEQPVNSEGGGLGVSGHLPDGIVPNDSLDMEVISVSGESIPEDFSEQNKEKYITGSRKPKASPSQWGASQVHPHLEQLLGDMTEEERLSVQLERERRMEEQDRMFSAGKLCLVLDLDHTLLNSAKFTEIESEWDQRLRAAESAERNRTARDGVERRELYRFPHMSMWTKLRPGIWKFLARASQLYELHVYTMGNKVYATEMAKLLDPTGKLFAGRVISKGDDGDGDDLLPKSKDLDGVLGMESSVVIIDDSARVWPHHSENLIVVERYMYFPCSRRQFGLGGPSLLEVGHDERESDGMLASALGVIDKIHQSFFKNPRLREVDVREILAQQQRSVLAGCKVVFSRVFPVGEAEPHRHPLWRTAEQFGAICTILVDDEVTHVVAISLGTDKVNWALETGRYVVRPAWLEASTILYRRANERDFPVLPQ